MNEPMRVGVIGAGAISGIYLKNMTEMFSGLAVRKISAKHLVSAQKKAAEYGIEACTTEELLADEAIDLAVILTPVDTHYELVKQALEAGKHVYVEKTITETTDQAAELTELAEKKGLYLGSAPDTFLGAAWQIARKLLDEQKAGTIHSFSISVNRSNDALTAALPFLRMPGAGALRDYLVYYLTALVSLLGPVARVNALIRTPYPERVNKLPGTADYGQRIRTPNESIIAAVVELESGAVGTIHQNNESVRQDQADFVLFGTKGMLYLSDPNHFGQPIYLMPVAPLSNPDGSRAEKVPPVKQEIPLSPFYRGNSRGIGPAEMADAIRRGVPNRASKELACHVLDVIEAMEESSRTGCMTEVRSTCRRPEPLRERL